MSALRSVSLCLFLFLFSVASLWAVDPDRKLSQYAHSSWLIRDGFLAGIPRVFSQTGDGYIWIGTSAGLWRFDGVRFDRWNPPNGEQLTSPRINSLLGGTDGSLWIGTANGLSHWQNNHLTNFVGEHGIVPSLIQAHDGRIWFVLDDPAGAAGRLCEVVGANIQCHGKEEGLPAFNYDQLAQDAQGNFWIGTVDAPTGIVHWPAASSRVYVTPELRSQAIEAISAGPDRSLWVGTKSSGHALGLHHLTRDSWKPFVANNFDSSTLNVNGLLFDRQKALWVGTNGAGLFRIYDGAVQHFGAAEGLSGNEVLRIFEDREGNVWVSTTKGIDN